MTFRTTQGSSFVRQNFWSWRFGRLGSSFPFVQEALTILVPFTSVKQRSVDKGIVTEEEVLVPRYPSRLRCVYDVGPPTVGQ